MESKTSEDGSSIVPKRKKLGQWLVNGYNFAGSIASIYVICIGIHTLLAKSDVTMTGSRYHAMLSNYNKIVLWRGFNITDKGKATNLVSAKEQILDRNHNVIATLKAELVFEKGEYAMFEEHEIQAALNSPIMFVQTDPGYIKLCSEEMYELRLIYTYRSNNMLSEKTETKTDSCVHFLIPNRDIKHLRKKATPEQTLKRGIELTLGD